MASMASGAWGGGGGRRRPIGLVRDARLGPALLEGAVLGILLVGRLRQRQFEVAALGFSAATAVLLLL